MIAERHNAPQHNLHANQAGNAGDCTSGAHAGLPWQRVGRFFATTVLASFILNEIWEMAQMSAYVETAGQSWTSTLGLAVPLVVAVSTTLAAKNGLLIRNRVAFKGARKLQAIIFDKPSTLTEGRIEGREVQVVSPGFLREHNIYLTDKRVEPLQAQGKTVVFVLVDGKLIGADCPGRHRPSRGQAIHRCPEAAAYPLHDAHW